MNVISPDDGSGGGGGGGSAGGGGGGDLGIDLPEYDFLGDAITSKVEELVNKFREWAGLTDDIDTWAEFMDTKLGSILKLVGAIASGLALWKLSKSFLNGMNWINNLSKNGLGSAIPLAVGLVLTATGIVIEWTGLKDIIKKGIDKLNLGESIGGGIMTTIGGSFIGKAASGLLAKAGITASAIEGGMGAGLAGALFGGGIAAVVAGLPAFVVGIYSAIKEGINSLSGALVAFGSTLTGLGAGAIGAALGAWGGPIGMGIGALIGIVVGGLTDLGIYIYQNWEPIKAKLTEIATSIKTFFTITIPNTFKNFDWKGLGKKVGTKTCTMVKNICDAMKRFFTQYLPDVWNKWNEGVKKFFAEDMPLFFKQWGDNLHVFFTEELPYAMSNIGDSFKRIGTAIWNGIKDGWNTAVKAVTDFGKGFVEGFKEALGIEGNTSSIFKEGIGKILGEDILMVSWVYLQISPIG